MDNYRTKFQISMVDTKTDQPNSIPEKLMEEKHRPK